MERYITKILNWYKSFIKKYKKAYSEELIRAGSKLSNIGINYNVKQANMAAGMTKIIHDKINKQEEQNKEEIKK